VLVVLRPRDVCQAWWFANQALRDGRPRRGRWATSNGGSVAARTRLAGWDSFVSNIFEKFLDYRWESRL
jgi:hypothetical protein